MNSWLRSAQIHQMEAKRSLNHFFNNSVTKLQSQADPIWNL